MPVLVDTPLLLAHGASDAIVPVTAMHPGIRYLAYTRSLDFPITICRHFSRLSSIGQMPPLPLC